MTFRFVMSSDPVMSFVEPSLVVGLQVRVHGTFVHRLRGNDLRVMAWSVEREP